MSEEAFYRDANGNLILRAFKAVGATESVSFAREYAWRTNGFPNGKPANMGEETIWCAYKQDK